ncbi:MAG: alpha/beta hydrolase [Proteobacteria bacterium]|nr:alpha/beta hydrolase [Pseudomonadota bacterium]
MADNVTEQLTIGDCTTQMMKGGTGPTMLYLHGAGGSKGWSPFMEQLSDRFSVLAPDHPGFGASDTPDWLDGMTDLVYFYLDFLEQLDLRDIHLVGHSMGGWLAAELAVRGTGRFRTLTLVSSAGIRVPGVPMGDLFMWTAEDKARRMVFDPVVGEQRANAVLTPEEADVALKNAFTSSKLCWSPRFHNPDLEKWLHRIKIPTMILWGENDPIFPPPYAEAYNEMIAGSELRIFPECAHSPQQEKLDDFIAGIDAITAKS